MMNVVFGFLGMGGTELMLVMGAVLLLFGPKKLPELARGLGKGIREFKKASNEVTEELERAVEEPPAAPLKKTPPEGSLPHSSASSEFESESDAAAKAEYDQSASHSEQSQQPK